MTNDQVHEAVVAWVKKATGNPRVIADHQSGPRPAEPYIVVNLTGTADVREHHQLVEYSPTRDDEAPPTEDTAGDPEYAPITATPVIEVEWRFSIHAYGSVQATDVLRPINSARRLSQILEPLYPSLLIHDLSPVRDLTEWVNAAWEQRAQVDLFVHGLTRDGFVIDTIDAITYTANRIEGS